MCNKIRDLLLICVYIPHVHTNTPFVFYSNGVYVKRWFKEMDFYGSRKWIFMVQGNAYTPPTDTIRNL